jgi:hypothetical protein
MPDQHTYIQGSGSQVGLEQSSVLYDAGLRRTELTHFNLSHVESNHLMLFGKGRQWRQAIWAWRPLLASRIGLSSGVSLELRARQ